jgi:hypothetical protein
MAATTKPDFINKWDKEKEYYKKAIIDEKGNTWPRVPKDPARENSLAEWNKRVINPITKEYYKGKKEKYMPDGKGGEILQVQDMEAHDEVIAIIRLRDADGDEFLLTKRRYIGYDSFGNEDRIYMPYPEMYEQPKVPYRTVPDGLTGNVKAITHGPQGSTPHYLILFSPEAVDALYAKKWSKPVHLAVKDGITGEGKTCPDLEMFKYKSFQYIKDMEYMTPAEKERKREEFETQQGDKTPRKQTKQ